MLDNEQVILAGTHLVQSGYTEAIGILLHIRQTAPAPLFTHLRNHPAHQVLRSLQQNAARFA